jgi:hypothetical protein
VKGKRPKVRYVGRVTGIGSNPYMVCHVDYGEIVSGYVCDCPTATSAKRVAAALNFYEAHKRGEL